MQNISKYFNKKKINTFLLIIFTFNCIFIPYDTFELKMISFLLLLVLNIKDIFNIQSRDELIVFSFGFLLTSLNILISIFLTKGHIYQNIQQGYVPYILLLYPIIKKNDIQYDKIFIPLLKYLAYLIVIGVILDILRLVPLYSNPLMMWYHNSENAMIGKGSNFAVGYMMFIKTTPMLIVAIPYLINEKKFVSSILVCLAMILSGTRANMLMSIIVLFFSITYYFYKHLSKDTFRKYIFLIIICIIIIIIKGDVINFIIQMFMNKANNDLIRNEILISIIDTWKKNPISFITGSGYVSVFYNIARGEFTYIVELSYWNLLRQIGIISFLFVMMMYFFPIYYIIKSRENYSYIFAYIGYLVIAYTNPLLYTSTGLCVLLFMYYMCLKINTNSSMADNYDFQKKVFKFKNFILSKILKKECRYHENSICK